LTGLGDLLRWLALTLTVSLSVGVLAAPATGKKAELQEQQGALRGRIESLSKDLAKKEESRAGTADQLREAELAISDANRRLRELVNERRAIETELANLEAQSTRLDRQTTSQQSQLAKLLHHQFVGGDSDSLQLLLAGRDPNQAARDRYFLTQLSRAKADLIQQLRGVASEKKKLAAGVREQQSKIAEIEKRQQDSRAQLVDKQKQRQAMLDKLAGQIKSQRAEIGALKRDEQRLSSLVTELARRAQQRRAQKVGADSTAHQRAKVAPGSPTTPTTIASAPVLGGKPVRDADPGAVGDFGALRGKLRLPVAGAIAARFGSPRAEGGTNWRGLFIRAEEGGEVKAVAAGKVVFADWLRGFGNLLIVDHGDDFLSIYGNNQSLLRGDGQDVKPGETIATVGSTGGNPEPGLYFELRHRGQAFDPLKWARR
jgi:septal ring factor EnvC (AmiA/AmiB activator)